MTDSRTSLAGKEIERLHLESFLSCWGSPDVDSFKSSEKPDFILKVGSVEVGLEVTEATHSSSGCDPTRRAAEAGFQDFKNALAAEFEVSFTQHGLCISFIPRTVLIKKREAQTWARKVAGFLSDKAFLLGRTYRFSAEDFDTVGLSRVLDSLSVSRYAEGGRTFVSYADAGFIPDLTVDTVSGIVSEKDKKREAHYGFSKDCWLLIVISAAGLSTRYDIITHIYQTGFSRVFLFERFEIKFWELRVVDVSK